jgi:hypothetical protein
MPQAYQRALTVLVSLLLAWMVWAAFHGRM